MLVRFIILIIGLVLASCTTTLPKPQKENSKIERVLPPSKFTYLDEFHFDPYPFVGSVNFSDGRLIGSGVVIAPNLILTAAHVPFGKEDLMFVEYDGDTHCIEEVIYYEPYNPVYLDHDIAILVLETETDEQPVEFAEYTHKRMKLTTVGYGTGRKRYSNYGVFWYYGRLIAKPQFMIILPLEASIWFGDSGGAVLSLDNKLIGIMSYFQTTDNGKIYENGCASIEYYKDWIEGIKNERTLEGMVR